VIRVENVEEGFVHSGLLLEARLDFLHVALVVSQRKRKRITRKRGGEESGGRRHVVVASF
jgi:hypothetical protein